MHQMFGVLSLAVLGSSPMGAPIVSSPSSGVVTVAEKRAVFSFGRSGNLLWRHALPEGTQILGAPAVAPDSTVYLRTREQLIALTNQGSLKWARTLDRAELATAWLAPVALPDSGVVVVSGRHEIRAFRPSGALAWQHVLPAASALAAPPTVAPDGTVFLRLTEHILALDHSGQPIWKIAAVQ